MEAKFRGKIINALRKLTWSYSPRNEAKNKQKVAPATFECESCGIWVYTGSKKLETLDLSPPNDIIKGKIYLDHIDPIIAIEGFSKGVWSWDEYIPRMFCETEGFQVLCKTCHDAKTKEENEARKKYRKSNKKA